MTLILQGTDNSVSSPAVQGGTAGTTTGVYYPATNQIALATNGTQAVLVDASQRVGLGITPTQILNLYSTTDTRLLIGQSGATPYTSTLELAYQPTGNYGSILQYSSSPESITLQNYGRSSRTTTQGGIYFQTKLDNTTIGNALVINGYTGNLALRGAVTTADGTGITFPATQSASSDANTLDDYEEGSWTPSVGGSATYAIQSGRYTKVGRIVTFSFDLAIAAIGTGSTQTITGLPFAQGTGLVRSGVTVAYYTALATNVIYIVGVVDGTTSQIFFSSSAASSSAITDAINPLGNNTRIIASGTYTSAT